MPNSLSDWVTSLAPVVVMSAAFIYASGVHVLSKWRRGRGVVAPGVAPVYRPRAELEARVAREQLVAREAERVVRAYSREVGGLYVEPTEATPQS